MPNLENQIDSVVIATRSRVMSQLEGLTLDDILYLKNETDHVASHYEYCQDQWLSSSRSIGESPPRILMSRLPPSSTDQINLLRSRLQSLTEDGTTFDPLVFFTLQTQLEIKARP